MNPRYQKFLLIPLFVGAITGCASQGERRDADVNPACAALGAVVGGGTAAAITIAAGPIGAGVSVGAFLGAMACHQMATQKVAVTQAHVAASPPPPAPAPTSAPAVVPVDADSDGDGVADRLDRCPGTPADTHVGRDGCPDVLLTLTGIHFQFDSAAIDPASSAVLDQAVATLAATRDVTVRVEGHCDSVGTDAYNRVLSNRRALAVSAYLVAHAVPQARLKAIGMGESRPVAPNDRAQGRILDRRVEFHVEHGVTGANTDVETWRDIDRSGSTHEVDDTQKAPR
jgi:OOP family OmpA-OmpF porin